MTDKTSQMLTIEQGRTSQIVVLKQEMVPMNPKQKVLETVSRYETNINFRVSEI